MDGDAALTAIEAILRRGLERREQTRGLEPGEHIRAGCARGPFKEKLIHSSAIDLDGSKVAGLRESGG